MNTELCEMEIENERANSKLDKENTSPFTDWYGLWANKFHSDLELDVKDVQEISKCWTFVFNRISLPSSCLAISNKVVAHKNAGKNIPI